MIEITLTKERFITIVHPYILTISDILGKNGFKSYLVGGAVRDMLIGEVAKDFDIATDATPDQLLHLFPHSLEVGAKFGTIVVIPPLEERDIRFQNEIQVTTFRKDAKYINGRWPEHVEFSKTIDEDLCRRDFTINAFAVDLAHIKTLASQDSISPTLKDNFSGIEDLEKHIIRAVGNPLDRMQEDGLRAIRACRFASRLSFQIDEATFDAIQKSHDIFKLVSIERIREEFIKILHTKDCQYGIRLLDDSGLLTLFLPELLEGKGVVQNKYHVDDIYTHILKTCTIADSTVKVAALFHDIGKPRTKDGEHFFGHEHVGALMSEEIMKRMKFPKQEILEVKKLVELHMFHYLPTWTDAAVRRFLAKVGNQDLLEKLFLLRIADVSSNPKNDDGLLLLDELKERIKLIKEKEDALTLHDLAIRGDDLLILGLSMGPEVGVILHTLLGFVLDDPTLNERETLLTLAKELVEKSRSPI